MIFQSQKKLDFLHKQMVASLEETLVLQLINIMKNVNICKSQDYILQMDLLILSMYMYCMNVVHLYTVVLGNSIFAISLPGVMENLNFY